MEIFDSSKQEGQQPEAVAPKFMYQLFGPPASRSIREWKCFVLKSGIEMLDAKEEGDKKKYRMAVQKILYGKLCVSHLKKFYPWDEFRQKNWWKQLEIPKFD